MPPNLRPPLDYSNWVWILGTLLIVVAVAWVVTLLVLYRVSAVEAKTEIKTLGELQRSRYNRHIDEIEADFQQGTLTPQEAHLALAALIRAAATEKTGYNVESQTPQEVAQQLHSWPVLSTALQWCEDETFPVGGGTKKIERGVDLAKEVVNE